MSIWYSTERVPQETDTLLEGYLLGAAPVGITVSFRLPGSRPRCAARRPDSEVYSEGSVHDCADDLRIGLHPALCCNFRYRGDFPSEFGLQIPVAGPRPATAAKLWKKDNASREGISFGTIEKLCDTLACRPGDLFEYEPSKKNKYGVDR